MLIKWKLIFSELDTYKEKLNTLDEIISFFNKFYPIEKSDKIKYINEIKTMLYSIPLEEFDKRLKQIEELKDYKKQIDNYKTLGNSIFFMEIFNSSKDKLEENKKKNISIMLYDNLIIKGELNLIKNYFGYNPNDEKFDVEQIYLELIKLIHDGINVDTKIDTKYSKINSKCVIIII